LVAVLGRTETRSCGHGRSRSTGTIITCFASGHLTLVYDVYSEEWVDWDALGEAYWPVNIGFNWVGGTGVTKPDGSLFGSNVLVGDDTFPLLYFLDPNQPYDENPEALDPEQAIFFERVIQGQVVVSGREVQPCFACWITTDMGAPAYARGWRPA
jgi:hypothetical protein